VESYSRGKCPGTAVFAAHTHGDAHDSLNVDGAEFLLWQRQLGGAATVGTSAAEREPAPQTMLIW